MQFSKPDYTATLTWRWAHMASLSPLRRMSLKNSIETKIESLKTEIFETERIIETSHTQLKSIGEARAALRAAEANIKVGAKNLTLRLMNRACEALLWSPIDSSKLLRLSQQIEKCDGSAMQTIRTYYDQNLETRRKTTEEVYISLVKQISLYRTQLEIQEAGLVGIKMIEFVTPRLEHVQTEFPSDWSRLQSGLADADKIARWFSITNTVETVLRSLNEDFEKLPDVKKLSYFSRGITRENVLECWEYLRRALWVKPLEIAELCHEKVLNKSIEIDIIDLQEISSWCDACGWADIQMDNEKWIYSTWDPLDRPYQLNSISTPEWLAKWTSITFRFENVLRKLQLIRSSR